MFFKCLDGIELNLMFCDNLFLLPSEHRAFDDEQINGTYIAFQCREKTFAEIAVTTEIPCMEYPFPLTFNQKHIGIEGGMTDKERSHNDTIIHHNAFPFFERNHALCGNQLLAEVLMCVQSFIFAPHYIDCSCSHVLCYTFRNKMMKSDVVAMVVGIENSICIYSHLGYLISRKFSFLRAWQIVAEVNEYFRCCGCYFRNATAYLIGPAMNGDVHVLFRINYVT